MPEPHGSTFVTRAAAAIMCAAVAYASLRGCSRRRPRQRSIRRQPSARRARGVDVVVLTDIAKDIDDTVALIYLSGLAKEGRIRLRGIVCSGGSVVRRTAVAARLLRDLRVPPTVVVAAGSERQCSGTAFPNADVVTHTVPEGDSPPAEDPVEMATRPASELLAEWCLQATGDLVIICLGPVTDLAQAVADHGEAILSPARIRGLLIQGQLEGRAEDEGLPSPRPSAVAYNLRADMPGAEVVLHTAIGQATPVVLLGKHAAYAVPMTLADVDALDAALAGRLCWSVTDLVLATLLEFVRDPTSADVLERAYKVRREDLLIEPDVSDQALRARIVAALPHLTVPYDVLCCMCIGYLHPPLAPQAAPLRPALPHGRYPFLRTIGNDPGSADIDAGAAKHVILEACRAAK
eukprot:TRINITY_DN3240_c0_g4_i1.p1 TRINITY_DN3240_c0_g4~~TRINITY_DN3240_c0_g4_i1.p1  ORF type:complete len:407 (+),score=61.01 TRINITY_DN3240_c0_g4_i1:52-1272(+)